jgi:O-antigen/teichoic acid export membrane protein
MNDASSSARKMLTPERIKFAQGFAVVGLSLGLASAVTFLLSLIAARVLDPAQFGAFGALISATLIASTVGLAAQLVAAREVSKTDEKSRPGVTSRILGASYFRAVLVGVVTAVVFVPVGIALEIPLLGFVLNGLSVGAWYLGFVLIGLAQGHESHTRLAFANFAVVVTRYIGGFVGLYWLQSVNGVGIGFFVGTLFSVLFGWLIVRPLRVKRTSWYFASPRTVIGASVALLLLYALTNVDVLLARLFLSPDQSGEYAVGALAAKIAFFLPATVMMMLYPRMAKESANKATNLALAMTIAISLISVSAAWFFGQPLVQLLGGARYEELASEIWIFAAEGSAFALVQVLLWSGLAAEDKKVVFLVTAGVIALVLIVSIWANSGILPIVLTTLGVSLTLALIGLFLPRPKVASFAPAV